MVFGFVVRSEIIFVVEMLLARLTVVMSEGVGPVLLQRRMRLKLPIAVVAPMMLVGSLPVLLQGLFIREEAIAGIAADHA